MNDEKSKPRLSFTHYDERHVYLKAVKQTCLFSSGSPERFSLDVLVSLLRQENAVDICVIEVPEQIKYTDYFIVVSGVSTRHLRAMALYAIKVVTKPRLMYKSDALFCVCPQNWHKGLFVLYSISSWRMRASRMWRLRERTQRTGCALTSVCKMLQTSSPMQISQISGDFNFPATLCPR